ncbi:UPF0028 protein YchK [Nitrincola lacisaponensis]|uniref:UPF0028 protein YchK n=1 Tax=Nitrincola lacisaponensis TaxID=267850 RepID=A0A063Y241_9GAMM|nr:patatin-like phospholipase family protein [Nitrincola lacisaponensis]KDE38572.1 UPF0028 protein YchK [Nitrincola lacisaponensis]
MPRVSLVLGAGGARGYAHIGVINQLCARGYEIVSISGSSMGALVGGVYAAGGLDAYAEWVGKLRWIDVVRLLDLHFSHGTIRGDKVFAKLESLIGNPSIESLPLHYTAVATDLSRQKEVWFQQGPLLDAIRASSAVPGVFTPVHKAGSVLVDGAVLNPLPMIPTVAVEADMILAVDLNAADDEVASEVLPGIRHLLADRSVRANQRVGVMLSSMEVLQSALSRYKIAGYQPDLLIRIPKSLAGFHEFHRATELIDLGNRIAARQLDVFEARSQPDTPQHTDDRLS